MEYIVLIATGIGGLVGVFVSIFLMKKQKDINKGNSKAKPGDRFVKVVAFSGDKTKLEKNLKDLLFISGFKPKPYGDEKVFRKGEGMMTACQMIKYTFIPEGIKLEAFVILFGAKESGLTGFSGIVVKKPLKEFIDKIIQLIELS